MLFAQKNTEKNNIKMYIFLLDELIDKDNNKIQPLFISLYKDTKNIINDTISYYKIENKDFVPLISFFVSKYSDYFREIDTDTLKKEDFSRLKTYLKEAATAI